MAGKGPSRSWRFVGAFLLVSAAVRVLGCGVDEPPPDPTDGFDTEAMLTAYGQAIVFPTLTEFADALSVLDADVQTWERSLESADGRLQREAAQVSWQSAMAVWQRLELMQVGPLGSSISTIAGADLRDDVYSWPTVNACRVDQETLEGAWTEGAFFDVEFVNVRGLDALEHMLWATEGESRCADGVEIIESGAWAAAGADGVQRARASYASAIVVDIAAIADVLLDQWDPAGGDWGTVLATAGESESAYEDRGQALDQVFAALFYIEVVVKDRKLAQPLGLRDCDGVSCPHALESQFADLGLDHIRQNLDAARTIFTGGEGLGFDDLLAHADRPDLATTLLDALDDAVVSLDAVQGSALEAIVADPGSLLAVHDALKGFTDVLKGDFALTLLLDVPSDAANDND